MVPDIRDITADHSPTPIHTVTEAAASERTPHAILTATTAVHATLQLMDAPVNSYVTIPIGIVVPHPALAISPAGTTHTTPWTGASLAPSSSCHAAQESQPWKVKQSPRPSTPHGQKLSPLRFPFRLCIRC